MWRSLRYTAVGCTSSVGGSRMNGSPSGKSFDLDLRELLTKVLPWVLLVVVTWMALDAYADYRHAVRETRASASAETTAAQDATGAADVKGEGTTESVTGEGPQVVVLVDGLNMRLKPQTSATVVKKLDKGVRLFLIEKTDGWYHVRDAQGYEGYIAAGGQYTKLEE